MTLASTGYPAPFKALPANEEGGVPIADANGTIVATALTEDAELLAHLLVSALNTPSD